MLHITCTGRVRVGKKKIPWRTTNNRHHECGWNIGFNARTVWTKGGGGGLGESRVGYEQV